MAAVEDQYFYEDEVYRIDKRGHIEFGMVLENSELVSSDENSDGEEGAGMKKGQIRVAWHPSGVEEVISEKKVGLADRSLMPGDVVRRMIKGKDTQRGYCRDISVTACVQVVGTKQVIPNVKSEHLVPLEEFAEDIAVCLDSWVGGIKMVHSKLHLYLPDAGPGSRCVINELEANGLDEFDEKKDPDSEFPHRSDYYPGQVLYGPLHCLEYANWTQCTKDMKAQRNKPNKVVQVVVEGVETTSVGVHWQCRAYSKDGAGNDKEQPKFLVQGDDLKRLKLLNVFEPCTLQVGDRNYYNFRDEDTVITKEQWKRNQRDLFRPLCKDRDRGSERQPHRRCSSHKHSVVNGLTAKSSGTEPASKASNRSTKQNQDMDIMSCQDPKAADTGLPRSKEPSTEQSRKKRITGDSKLSYNRLKLAEMTSAKSSSHSSKRLATGEPRVEESSHTEGDGECRESVPEDKESEAVEDKDHSSVKVHKTNASHLVCDEVDFDDEYSTSEEASISSGCSSTGSLGLKKRGPALMTKVLKKKKLRRAKKRAPQVTLEPGLQVVVETLSTSSVADVIWQDGSVERGIPSTQLYPIHHLDDQEFFPGDFVIENKDENSCMRVYGVIQSVDHAGRTSKVKWFKTYTSNEEPQPSLLEENEVSVYDLKDHPDFQYRPGTVVIRVANFEGEDVNCTAGQVLDNYPEGRVKVWWVDGHVSMCWPQDLYKCGEYDSEDGELWEETNSEASWETESEDTVAGEGDIEPEYDSLRPKLAANIEKARIAMSRLEEIFTQNPALQNTDVMRRLLEVYKDCRYLDKLMNTSFFHEKHFEGLLEKVRERGRVNVAQRVADQVSRLFHPNSMTSNNSVSDPDAESFPELALTMQLAEQINELVQAQCSAAQSPPKNSNYFLEKLYEHHYSLKRVSQHIRQLFQNSLCPRNNSQDKDACNNEKQDGSSSQERYRILGEAKFNACDFGESDSNKTYTLRLIFVHPEDPVATPVKASSSGAGASSSPPPAVNRAPSPTLDDTSPKLTEEPSSDCDAPESDRQQQSLPDKITSGEFLAESLSSLERRVSVAAAAAVAPGSTRKLARRMSSILSKFGSVRCELLVGDEVVYSKDLGTPRLRTNQCPTVQPSLPRVSSLDTSQEESCSSSQTTDELAVASSVESAEDPNVSAESAAANSNNAVCVRLCSLIKAQLVKAHAEVTRRYGGQQLPMTLSDAANSVSPGSNPGEEVESINSAVPPVLESSADTVEIVDDVPPVDLDTSVPEPEKAADVGLPQPMPLAEEENGSFSIEDCAPNSHKFKLTMFQPVDHQSFYRTVRKEIKLLRSALPCGIWVKGFEDRMDLYSVMIRGPEKTPYEDGLFLFDFQLSPNYPNEPPLCHYISYCSDRLNPNLYEDGKVCVSLLGTWSGKGTELWSSSSNLLQVIVSIQGLILVSEPYFNEAGYEKQKGSQQGRENSRMYNEMVILKLVQAMSKLVQHPPPVFEEDIRAHFQHHAPRFASRLNKWLDVSDHYNNSHPLSPTTPTSFKEITGEELALPEFPLIPASKGFCLTLKKTLSFFKEVISSVGIIPAETEEPHSESHLALPTGSNAS